MSSLTYEQMLSLSEKNLESLRLIGSALPHAVNVYAYEDRVVDPPQGVSLPRWRAMLRNVRCNGFPKFVWRV